MATKATGAEFKRFYNDPEFWPEDAYHDDLSVSVDGVVNDDCDLAKVDDNAVIKIEGGIVFGVKGEPSVESHFKAWRKKQTTRFGSFECPVDKLDAVVEAIRAAGGKPI
jgi:hypothetical protein